MLLKMQKKNFKIDSEIYGQEVIERAIADFSDIAPISFQDWELEVTSWGDMDEIFREFINYCIALYNES